MIIRKHVVQVRCLDYGKPLETVYTLATSVDDGAPVLDGPEFKSYRAAEEARDMWLIRSIRDNKPADIQLLAGEFIKRQSDMNPHGLI